MLSYKCQTRVFIARLEYNNQPTSPAKLEYSVQPVTSNQTQVQPDQLLRLTLADSQAGKALVRDGVRSLVHEGGGLLHRAGHGGGGAPLPVCLLGALPGGGGEGGGQGGRQVDAGQPAQRGGGGRVWRLGGPLAQPRPPPAGVTVGEEGEDKVGGQESPVDPGPGASGVVVQGEAGLEVHLEVHPPGEGGRGGLLQRRGGRGAALHCQATGK